MLKVWSFLQLPELRSFFSVDSNSIEFVIKKKPIVMLGRSRKMGLGLLLVACVCVTLVTAARKADPNPVVTNKVSNGVYWIVLLCNMTVQVEVLLASDSITLSCIPAEHLVSLVLSPTMFV